MEPKDKFSTVHDDFFGNIVGTIVNSIKTISTRQTIEFIADWSLPTPSPVQN